MLKQNSSRLRHSVWRTQRLQGSYFIGNWIFLFRLTAHLCGIHSTSRVCFNLHSPEMLNLEKCWTVSRICGAFIISIKNVSLPYLSGKNGESGSKCQAARRAQVSHNALITAPISTESKPQGRDTTQPQHNIISRRWFFFDFIRLHCWDSAVTTILHLTRALHTVHLDTGTALNTHNSVLKWHLSCCIIPDNPTAQRQTATTGVRLSQNHLCRRVNVSGIKEQFNKQAQL